MTRTAHEPNRGFTLVELLVVVAIIGLLLALVVPQLGKSMFRARMTSCSANLRRVGQAYQEFINENDGFLPYWKEASGGAHALWGQSNAGVELALKKYLRSPDEPKENFPTGDRVWRCPASGTVLTDEPERYVYHHTDTGAKNNINDYSGLYYHYYNAMRNDKALNKHYIRASRYTQVAQGFPVQWCSKRLHGAGTNYSYYNRLGIQGNHGEQHRPCLFLDGHVTILSQPRYTEWNRQDILQANAEGHYPFDGWAHTGADVYMLTEY